MSETVETPPQIETAYFLPIDWQFDENQTGAAVATAAFIEAVLATSEPVSLLFELTVGGGTEPRAGWVVSAPDESTPGDTARLVGAVATALIGGQGLGDPEPRGSAEPSGTWYNIRPAKGPGREIFNHLSAPWAVAANLEHPTTLRLELIANTIEDEEQNVLCRLSVCATGAAGSVVASLVAADPPGPVRLEAVTHGSLAAVPITLPLRMVAHIASSPARIRDGWPRVPTAAAGTVVDALSEANPPHVAVFGGSGLGKTTLCEHLIARSLGDGNTPVVLCPHGDLAARAASIMAGEGVQFDAFDIGCSEPAPRWNICIPPPGVSTEQWASDLVHVVRAVWWNAPDDWFGPVWYSSVRPAIRVLVEDPDGPHSLSRILDVLRPEPEPWVEDAIGRIGDRLLDHQVRQTARTLDNDTSHYTEYIVGKFEPFLADPRLRSMLDHPDSTVGIDGPLHGRPLIVSAPASAIGELGSSLVLSCLATQLWHRVQAHPRTDGSFIDLIVDEAHRLPHTTIEVMLAEARKFGLRLRLATQSPGRLPERLRDSILTNSGAIATFRCGPADARALTDLYPTFPTAEFSRLQRHWVAVTTGDADLAAPAPPPLVDAGDTAPLADAHRRTADRGNRDHLLDNLAAGIAGLRDQRAGA